MNNEYKNDYVGTPMLVLNYDGSMSADISVDNGDIMLFSCIYDDCSGISIPTEDWEQVKEFVDSQIKLLNNKDNKK